MLSIVVSPAQVAEPWGGFVVQKSFSPPPGELSGVIVQTVTKTTRVTVHETPPRVLTTSREIAEFTSNQVQYATHTYSELFPVVNGEVVERDNFQNGAVLRYEKEKRKWYADDEPPTSGTITMVGTLGFVRLAPSEAKALQAMTDAQAGTWPGLNAVWSFAPTTPANGLGYTESRPEFPAQVRHTVTVTWEKDGSPSTVNSTVTEVRGGRRRQTRRARKSRRRYSSF
jgi:hypothetical protein